MTVHSRIENSYKRLKSSYFEGLESRFVPVFRQLENEVGTWSTWYSIPLRKRIRLLKYGFLSPASELYDLDSTGEDRYLSFRDRVKTGSINAPWGEILDNKYLFHRELAEFPDVLPVLYAIIHSGRVTPVDGEINGAGSPSEFVFDLLRDERRLVLKPVKGATGTDIYFIESTARDGTILLNDEELTAEEATRFVESLDDFLVTEHLSQCNWLDELYPHSLNTMRILTMWDDEDKETFIASAAFRIGTEQSRPVDNFSQGGVSAPIDVESGELGTAAKLESGELRRYDEHPDTGTEISGRKIEEWGAIRETVLKVAESVSLSEYVGWDVTLSSDGSPKIIEANNRSDVNLLQVHEPLLSDDRVRRFYERHDVI